MKWLISIFIIAFIIFFPSLFVFFTNDDFFFLHISQAHGLGQFINFFNIFHGPEGFGMYRPLTTQVFYFISTEFFHFQPMPLHIISFAVFFAVIYLIYKLVKELSKNEKMSVLAAFLYAVSATHFGHLYYLATFQELGMTLFVLLSCLSLIKGKNTLSLLFFILGLMSKETAIVAPILLGLIYIFLNKVNNRRLDFKKLFITLLPFAICTFVYLIIRIFFYGFASGDTYVWDFSIRKIVNTSFWYLVWSLNLPESLLDFIGPGLKVNPNLFIYWSKEILPILVLFMVQCVFISWIIAKSIFTKDDRQKTEVNTNSSFCIAWFIVSLLPVLFLPIHKFTFYLTLPLIGIVFRLAYLLVTSKVSTIFISMFLLTWTLTSVFTLKFTVSTNWITQGETISKNAFNYFNKESTNLIGKKVVLVDTENDKTLPWSPTEVVRTALSKNNFFEVFYPRIANNVSFFGKGDVVIKSRQFLGY